MMTEQKEIQGLIPRLVRDDDNPQLKNFASIEDVYTYNAKGLNVDYILVLTRSHHGGYRTEKYSITKAYEEVLKQIKTFYVNESIEGLGPIISYIKTTGLIEESQKVIQNTNEDHFNYCITLSDRYMPIIYLSISNKLSSMQGKEDILDRVYQDNKYRAENDCENELERRAAIDDLQKSYNESKKELKSEICNYIALWIHAYRFMQTESKLNKLNNNSIILASHRSHGWFKPLYRVNKDLTVELNTNFGYGNSSYFYVMLVYKGIQIFPFMEWVDYKFAQASKMEKYSVKYPSERENKRRHSAEPNSELNKKSSIIKQEDWNTALNDLAQASNLCDTSSRAFIDKYISEALDKLIEKLEEIVDYDTDKLNEEYRDFDYTFKTHIDAELYAEKIKLMDVKGSIISNSLDLIGQIVKLEEFINTRKYVIKIQRLNVRLLPILQETIPYSQQLKDELESKVNTLTEKLKVIWQDKGLRDYTQKKRDDSLGEKQREHFEFLKEEHMRLSNEKKEAEQDLEHSITLLNSIKRYVRNIENYFEKVQ